MNNPNQYPIGMTYHVELTTGLITLLGSGTATVGHIGAFRWGSAVRDCLIHRVRAVWNTVAGFTAEQEVGMDLFVVRGFTASKTTTLQSVYSFTSPGGKIWTPQAASLATQFIVSGANGGEVTGGTHTFDAQPLDHCSMVELATGAGVYRGSMSCGYAPPPGAAPLRLVQDEGLILRNYILMGTAGTARVSFAIDYTEQPV